MPMLTRTLALVFALSALLFTGCTDTLVEPEVGAATDQLVMSEELTTASKTGGSLTVEDVTGSTDAGDVFEGTLTINRFINEAGQLVAEGTLTGTLTDAAGDIIGSITDFPVNIPLTGTDATCDILHLELGPIDLDLLGLVVHVDQIVVDIDAESGEGNLLGNLLCAVANLFNNTNASLNAIANLLNNILGALG